MSQELPTYSRPSRFHYRLRTLKQFPARLLCPCDAGVGTVRSFRIIPKYDVKLDDVLNARHLPPLGLKEFEEYLLYVEHSPENLYFWFWLKKYEETYAQLVDGEDKHGQLARELRESYACARATFLIPHSPLELNLSADVLDTLPLPPLEAENEPPVTPATFALAKRQVTDMLQHSLHAFVAAHSRNAGRRRGIFAIVVGLLTCAIGLVPILLSFFGKSRWLSFAALPCLWLGVGTLVAGLHGVCVVIFLFGDARQLHPYELVSPSEAEIFQARPRSRRSSVAKPGAHERFASEAISLEAKISRCDSDVGGSEKLRHQASHNNISSAAAAARTVDVQLPTQTSQNSMSVIAPFLAEPVSPVSPLSARTTTNTSSAFEWAIAPSNASVLARRSKASDSVRNIFQPMAEVLSPIVRRGQWEIVIRSFLVGLAVALGVCGICAAPYVGRRR
ncbi:hypothetical protein AURDEDRAFT_185128 [Auricularia subglabra TFB-10046 SS5]|nr:hypothetical protein AURDEDRAFT_185128 [Auricularia subglabra TFB-10046 SS5]